MFRTLDEKGDEVWKTGITPEGISADLITAGRLDAGLIQIMDKNHPSFRWDARGLTAYLETADGYDTTSGVRFNSRGLFGFSNINNAHISEINENNATFYLSEDGMRVQPPNFGSDTNKITTDDYAIIGKVDDNVYKGWDNGGLPVLLNDEREDYEESPKHFVKIMEVGSEGGDSGRNGALTIYSDGTLTANHVKFTGSVGWTAAASPSLTVYSQKQSDTNGPPPKPVDGTLYNKFANNHVVNSSDNYVDYWHKIYEDGKDVYKSETSDGGNTWSQVFLI
jgi:hypothetical protein